MKNTKKKHVNIPLFIPHLGCPHTCVFCNQRLISGRVEFDIAEIRREIEAALSTVGDGTEAEIAFFGGSFTGIDRGLMIELLDMASEYVGAGVVSGIRLSTRPDYIDEKIITILKNYPISAVELGIQSMDDGVLAAAGRGHTAAQSADACRRVLDAGIALVGQMMIGLPGADADSETATAQAICDMGAGFARVYPTVVFHGTELCGMMESGEYIPLDNAAAVERVKGVLEIFARRGVKVIRVGLCASENLASENAVAGGASHSAIGEMAMGELYYEIIDRAFGAACEPLCGADVEIDVPAGEISKCVGQNKINKKRLIEKYGIIRLVFKEDSALGAYEVKIAKITRYNATRRIDSCI